MPAFAAEISQAEADRLQGVFETYLGKAPSGEAPYVTVTPTGSAYKVTYDPSRLFAPLEKLGLKLELSSLTATIAPEAGGLWRLSEFTYPNISYAFDKEVGSYRFGPVKVDGVYDPALAAYPTLTATLESLTTETGNPTVKATVRQTGLTETVTSKPGVNGTADMTVALGYGAVSETLEFEPLGSGTSKVTVEVKSTGGTHDTEIKGARTRQFLDLWAFLVAHHDLDSIKAHQDEFKSKLGALLPVVDTLKSDMAFKDFSVQTPYGSGSIGTAFFQVNFSTPAAPSGSLEVKYRLADLKVESAFIPDWAAPLIPTQMDFGFNLTNFDIPSASKKLIEVLDLSEPEPIDDDQKDDLKDAFLPNGPIRMLMPASTLKGKTYTVSWEGWVDFEPDHEKTHMEIKATGFDEVIQALSKVKEKGVPETVIGLYAAKAMAKPGPDGGLVWVVDFAAGGELLVNGSPVGPKLK